MTAAAMKNITLVFKPSVDLVGVTLIVIIFFVPHFELVAFAHA
jgi:uncharacterized membrane protein YqjE